MRLLLDITWNFILIVSHQLLAKLLSFLIKVESQTRMIGVNI